jgi:hypothetical protein
MAARTTKKTATIDPNSVAIADFCQSQGINEQIFRLELMQHCDDADSTKTCDFGVATQVASTIQATSKALPQTIETPESITPQELQPSQETAQPQENSTGQNIPVSSKIATTHTAQGIETAAKSGNAKGTVPTALTEFIAKAQDDIELFDLVHVYRNEQILTNSESRDSELVLKLREQRLESRALVFDQLRDLNSRQPVPQELPELPSSLSEEIKALSDELGKQLNRVA